MGSRPASLFLAMATWPLWVGTTVTGLVFGQARSSASDHVACASDQGEQRASSLFIHDKPMATLIPAYHAEMWPRLA